VFSLTLVASIMAGAAPAVKTQPYEGQIRSIKVDKCGLQPGSCEGSVILAKAVGGEEITLAIKPGTWLKRGDQLVTIDELGVGNYVKVQATQIPGTELQQITVLEVGGSE
jgi:urease accessory protein UreE